MVVKHPLNTFTIHPSDADTAKKDDRTEIESSHRVNKNGGLPNGAGGDYKPIQLNGQTPVIVKRYNLRATTNIKT